MMRATLGSRLGNCSERASSFHSPACARVGLSGPEMALPGPTLPQAGRAVFKLLQSLTLSPPRGAGRSDAVAAGRGLWVCPRTIQPPTRLTLSGRSNVRLSQGESDVGNPLRRCPAGLHNGGYRHAHFSKMWVKTRARAPGYGLPCLRHSRKSQIQNLRFGLPSLET